MEDGRPVRIVLTLDSPSIVRALFIVVALLAAASLAGQVSMYFLEDGHLWGFVPQFNLDREMNVPTWFSSILFLFAAVLLWKAGDIPGPGSTRFRTHWRGLAVVFVCLSIDEVAAFHEMAVDPLRELFHAHGILYFSWVIGGAAFVVALALVFLRLWLSLPARTRALFLSAAFLFLSGALGMEMAAGRFVEWHGSASFSYALMANAEETLEMLGQVVFLKGLFTLFAG
jgi:hypothetical protein